MTTTENIVETYYRVCQNCFTMQDIKIVNGNNRQFDLLAVRVLEPKNEFHIESTISLSDSGRLSEKHEKEAIESLEKKFFGVAPVRKGKHTDHERGINYLQQINRTYDNLGLDSKKIERIYCRWAFYEANKELNTYLQQKNISKLSFRDDVLPALEEYLSTAHYEDDSLRTLSLVSEYRKQRGKVQ